MRHSLRQRIAEGGYDGYAYSYPHKTAYRPLVQPVPLSQAWEHEDKKNLFLYVHLPFCEMRCGFCNLFTSVQPGKGVVDQALAAIERQSRSAAAAIVPQEIAQVAFGGGTPSFLSESELASLFEHLGDAWPVQWGKVPVSFEASPGTISQTKLALLRQLGVNRLSLGVQSFVPADLLSLKRPQPAGELERACALIKAANFPIFNLDLIYGNEGQDAPRWQASLEEALRWEPEELYLYPLYVGKLTHLDRSGKKPGEMRRELYRQARDLLCAAGYRQISMRLFRRAEVRRSSQYCCQEDGMIGLGPGARSYTRELHYSTEYAVGQSGVKSIIADFSARTPGHYATADWGVRLNLDEQKRRYVIKSLLRAEGISPTAYRQHFGCGMMDDLPQLRELDTLELATETADTFRLNDEGLAWSDTIGPWLYSDAIADQMARYELI